MTTPTLETPRLILRPVCLEDASAIQKYFACWEIIQFMRKPPGGVVPWPYPENGAPQWLIKHALPDMAGGNSYTWGLVLKEQPSEVIGIVDVRLEGQEDNRGFWLGVPFQGKGLVTEAILAAHDYIFGELGAQRLVVHNARNNIASRRIKEKTGARFLHLRPDDYHNGCTESEVWEVRREDWLALKQKSTDSTQ